MSYTPTHPAARAVPDATPGTGDTEIDGSEALTEGTTDPAFPVAPTEGNGDGDGDGDGEPAAPSDEAGPTTVQVRRPGEELEQPTRLMSDHDIEQVLERAVEPPRVARAKSPRAPAKPPDAEDTEPRLVGDTTQLHPITAVPQPRRLGAYEITGVLSSGSMGVVYRGVHPTLHVDVAIKAVQGQLMKNTALVARFFAESLATARVTHPNVVRFFDFGYDAEGAAFLVMELLDGEPLTTRLARERQLDVPVAISIAIQICRGLAAAHAQGVIHRDVKPDNVFLCRDPADPAAVVVKLLDFGVAKMEGQAPTHTQQGDLLGTPAYMAPEQGRRASESDARSDLYSVGCVLFEMLCGVVPFPGSVVETLVAHQVADRPPARALRPSVPVELDRILDRLLAREPAARFGSAAEVAAALAAVGSGRAPSRVAPVRSGTEIVGAGARSSLRFRLGPFGPRALGGIFAGAIVLAIVIRLLAG